MEVLDFFDLVILISTQAGIKFYSIFNNDMHLDIILHKQSWINVSYEKSQNSKIRELGDWVSWNSEISGMSSNFDYPELSESKSMELKKNLGFFTDLPNFQF